MTLSRRRAPPGQAVGQLISLSGRPYSIRLKARLGLRPARRNPESLDVSRTRETPCRRRPHRTLPATPPAPPPRKNGAGHAPRARHGGGFGRARCGGGEPDRTRGRGSPRRGSGGPEAPRRVRARPRPLPGGAVSGGGGAAPGGDPIGEGRARVLRAPGLGPGE